MRVDPETDFPDRFVGLRAAYLVRAGRSAPVTMETVRRTEGGFLVKIAGIDRPEDAAAWRGALLAVPREAAAVLPEGRRYVFDVIGMAAVTDAGDALGTVDEVIRTPANDVFVIRGPRGEILVPAIASVVLAFDDAARRMIIRPMPGMIDEDRWDDDNTQRDGLPT
jgi:16S rRNA processing protein RimM